MVNEQLEPKSQEAMIKPVHEIAQSLEPSQDKTPQKSASHYRLLPKANESEEPHA